MAKGSAALSEAFAGISLMVGNLIKNFKLIWSGAAEIGGGFARLSVVVRAVFGAFAEPLAVGALALGVGLAIGLGGKETAGKIIADMYKKTEER